jgi:chitinase
MSQLQPRQLLAAPLAVAIGFSLCSVSVSALAAQVNCEGVAPWSAGQVYATTTQVVHQDVLYSNQWWTTNESPSVTGQWGVWKKLGDCGVQEDNLAPVTRILSPTNDSVVSAGENIQVQAEASDPDPTDSIAKVELWVNG